MRSRKANDCDDFQLVSGYSNLYKAHLSCRRGKRWKDSVASYDLRAPESTLYLRHLLESGKYEMGEYRCFTVNERGKKREIKSIKYRDRVVQKSLNDNVIVPRMIPKLIYENGSSQKGKGTDFHLALLKRHLREQYKESGAAAYILAGDFKGYFDSIRHDLVNEIYEKEFSDERIRGLIRHIHSSIPGGVGVPLGNQLSQADALLALNDMDHYIKERLRIKRYARYNDDFYLIHESKEYLQKCLEEIKGIAEKKGMRLNQKKTRIVPATTGFTFLGFRFYLTETGKVVAKIKPETKNRERRRLRKFSDKVKAGEMTYEDAANSYQCWRAHAKRGDTYYVLQDMDLYFYTLFQGHLSPEEKKRYVKLKVENMRRIEKRRKKQNGKSIKQSAGRRVGQGPEHSV